MEIGGYDDSAVGCIKDFDIDVDCFEVRTSGAEVCANGFDMGIGGSGLCIDIFDACGIGSFVASFNDFEV
jgi:hypothetical protein